MRKPKESIRRFDVFAEYNRQKAMAEGMPADEAKGYGLWLAKVVAARRFGGSKAAKEAKPSAKGEEPKKKRKTKWRALDDKPQTDKLFDKEIVNRMGREFYESVFVPAIRAAFAKGQSYVDIRDSLRQGWTPD
ncbi:MAG: hypothetical protein ACRDH2_02240 [Anaerolineales bacterium]